MRPGCWWGRERRRMSAATPHPLRNHNSGKCLEIADWRTDNGAPARQWNSEGRQANMEWDYCYPWISCAW